MQVGTKQIRSGIVELVKDAQKRGYAVEEMVECPTLNQWCLRCGEHRGFVCLCTREELREFAVTGAVTERDMVTETVTAVYGELHPCDGCGKLIASRKMCGACRVKRSRAK